MGSGAGNFIFSLLIYVWLLPMTLGVLLSLYIAGKGNRLLWIVPMIILRLLSAKLLNLIGITGQKKMDLLALSSEWMIAAILILGACGFRILMMRRKKNVDVPVA